MTKSRALDGRTALVTGGVSGIGIAIARGLAAAGCNIVICDIAEESTGADVCAGLESAHGVDATYVRADLSDPGQVERTMGETLERFGPIGILVNNAVVRYFAPITEFPLEEWERALAVNLTAAFLATKHLLPSMISGGYGRILNMTSVYGHRATVNRVDYVTTKTALQGLTRATALEIAATNVSCHALMPGSVQTPGIQGRIDEFKKQTGLDGPDAERGFLEGKQPSGRFVDQNSIVEVVLMLCGPAGLDMNGAILPIEGGWLARS